MSLCPGCWLWATGDVYSGTQVLSGPSYTASLFVCIRVLLPCTSFSDNSHVAVNLKLAQIPGLTGIRQRNFPLMTFEVTVEFRNNRIGQIEKEKEKIYLYC